MVVIEYMPAYLRASHQSAGNAGRWPDNGAARYAVTNDLADDMLEVFGEWCQIVPGARPRDYEQIHEYPPE